MRQVIKSNSHGNQVEVFEHGSTFSKRALNKEGNPVISREAQGYDWFGVETTTGIDGCKFIQIPKFKGKTFPQYNGISGNEKWIKKLIEFYIIEWNKRKFAIHGDLCLCNVIFGGEKVHIIDWEHFHYNSKNNFGFDIVNMLFIHLQYEYRWFNWGKWNWVSLVRESHKTFIRECVQLLGNTNFLKFPFFNAQWYIKQYMNKDKFILSKQSDAVIESLDYLCQ